MILKVRTSNVNSHLDEVMPRISWRYYDGVNGLHYSIYVSEAGFKAESKKWSTPDDVQEVWLLEPKPADGNLLFMAFDSAATGLMHLFCNTECYLLNDSGKTIERLI